MRCCHLKFIWQIIFIFLIFVAKVQASEQKNSDTDILDSSGIFDILAKEANEVDRKWGLGVGGGVSGFNGLVNLTLNHKRHYISSVFTLEYNEYSPYLNGREVFMVRESLLFIILSCLI